MTFHVFATTPMAGFPGAVAPYTVELRETFATLGEAQAFAAGKPLSAAAKALLDAMPSAYPAWSTRAYATGDYAAHAGATWRCVQGHTAILGWEPSNVPALWNKVQPPGASAWAQPVWYALPSQATYGGRLYRLVQAHASLTGWEPPNVPALWTDIGPASAVQPYARATFRVVSTADPDYAQVERAKEV